MNQSDRPFTKRQKQILKALTDCGRTEKEIADDLGISFSTLGTHLRVIYCRLGVHSRHQAVRAYRIKRVTRQGMGKAPIVRALRERHSSSSRVLPIKSAR